MTPLSIPRPTEHEAAPFYHGYIARVSGENIGEQLVDQLAEVDSLLGPLDDKAALARYAPGNLTHIVFDNQSLLSVGGFPTATATGSDLAGIARAAGIAKAATLTDVDAFRAAAVEAIRGHELACLVAKVEPVGPKSFHMDLHLLENRFEFQRALRPDPNPEGDPTS